MTWASFIELCWTLSPLAGFAAGYAAARVEFAHRRRNHAVRQREFRFAVTRPVDADTIEAALRGDL